MKTVWLEVGFKVGQISEGGKEPEMRYLKL